MSKYNPDTATRVYVGTYAKYNNGSIEGRWMDLEDYANKNEFLEACAALHSDEADPELMFQDYEGLPEELVNESGVDADTWDFLALAESDREILAAWWDNMGKQGSVTDDMESAREAYSGKYDSDVAFAQDFAEECCEVPDDLRWPYTHIDWESAARDHMQDYYEVNGHYFRNC